MTSEQPENLDPIDSDASVTQSASQAPDVAVPATGEGDPTPIRVVQNLSDLSDEEASAIAAQAAETQVRRAPKLGAFFFIGAIVGIILGLVFGFGLSDPNMTKRGIYITVSVVFVTTIVELIVGGLVVYLDKRSEKAASR